MTVSVVSETHPALFGSVDNLTLTAPASWSFQPGDVIIVGYRSYSRAIVGITGCGATWANRYTNLSGAFWIGTNLGSASNIVVDQTSTGPAMVSAILVRGLTSSALSGSGQAATSTTGAVVNPTAVTAGNGQIAVSMMRGQDTALAAISYPQASTPASGWDVNTPTPSATFAGAFAWRIPTAEPESHVLTAQGSTGDTVNVYHCVIGAYSAPATDFIGWGVPR